MERLNPLSDVVFSNIFRDMSSAPAMLGFINAVLRAAGDAPINHIIDIKSQYTMIADLIGKKSGRVDVRAEANDNQIFDTEVMLRAGLDMNERDVFYGGKLLGDNTPVGTPYDQLPRVRIINLLNYVIRKDSADYLQPVSLFYRKPRADGSMEVASDAIRIYHIQLPLFREQFQTLESVGTDELGMWLYAFDRGYQSESEMEVLSAMTEGLGTFAKKYNLALNDPRVRALYDYEMSAAMDEASRLSSAYKEGRQEARAEYMAKEKRQAIRRATRGDDPKRIAEDLEQPLEVILGWIRQ